LKLAALHFALPPAEWFGALVVPPEEGFNSLAQLFFALEASPLSVLRCSRLNTISIWFSQLAEVGVK